MSRFETILHAWFKLPDLGGRLASASTLTNINDGFYDAGCFEVNSMYSRLFVKNLSNVMNGATSSWKLLGKLCLWEGVIPSLLESCGNERLLFDNQVDPNPWNKRLEGTGRLRSSLQIYWMLFAREPNDYLIILKIAAPKNKTKKNQAKFHHSISPP